MAKTKEVKIDLYVPGNYELADFLNDWDKQVFYLQGVVDTMPNPQRANYILQKLAYMSFAMEQIGWAVRNELDA